jgi:HAD superfamily hydrolase (TIGR01509 family)
MLPTAVSIMQGLRKPAPAAFDCVVHHLQLPAERFIFVDDRQVNVDAAAAAGMTAIKFNGSVHALEEQLLGVGLLF